MDIDKLDNDASLLIQKMYEVLRKKPGTHVSEIRVAVEDIGRDAKGLRHPLVLIFNQFQSLRDALVEDEISLKEAEAELQKATNAFLNAVAVVSEFYAQNNTKKEVQDVLTRQFIRNATASSKADLNREVNKNGVYVGYAPIIPIVQAPIDVNFLKRKGLKVRSYEGYAILEKQLIVGMTLDMQGKISGLPHQSANKPSASYEDFVDTVKAKFRSLRLVEVGKPRHEMSASWTWLVPAKELDWISSSTKTRIITSWGFAFTGVGK